MKKLNIGVLFGGISLEAEVSFNSGRTICDHIDTNLFNTIPIFMTKNSELFILPWKFLYRGKIADFENRLSNEAQKINFNILKNLIDFIFIALHGQYAEDGRLQGLLELLKIPYLGSKVAASALTFDKKFCNDFLKIAGIKTAKNIFLSKNQIKNYNEKAITEMLLKENMHFPLIIKPKAEGSSLGVFIAKNSNELEILIKKSAYINPNQINDVLVEEKINGTEFSSICITSPATNELIVLPQTEIILENNNFFDYSTKYMPGKVNERTPAHFAESIIKEIQTISKKIMQLFELKNFAMIDGFVNEKNEIIIIEINSNPGMTPTSLLCRQSIEAGINKTELINNLIKTDLNTYKINFKNKMKNIKNNNKLNIGLLLGGASNEKEVSLDSGRNVFNKLNPEKFNVTPIFLSNNLDFYKLNSKFLAFTSTREIESRLNELQKIEITDLKQFDFIFIALHGGIGEDGTLQGALELLEIPYNGSSVLTSALCMNKSKTNSFLKLKNFTVPNSILLTKENFEADQKLENIEFKINFPCILKPNDDGCSALIECIKNKEELILKLKTFFTKKKLALIEEKINGIELTIGVLGNENPIAFVPSETITASEILSLEEKFLPGCGENQTPARLTETEIKFVQDKAIEIYSTLECRGVARIDCFLQRNGKELKLVFLEINTLPALTPATCLFHQAAEAEIRPTELLEKIIELGLEATSKETVFLPQIKTEVLLLTK